MLPITQPIAHEAPPARPAPATVFAGAPATAAVLGNAAATAGASAAAATAAPNLALRLDPELGLVLLEFRDGRGEVTLSLPTSRELDAYRRAARAGAPRTEG